MRVFPRAVSRHAAWSLPEQAMFRRDNMNFRHLLPTAAVLTLLSTSSALAGPLTLTCAPGQRAIVRETLVRGAPVTSAECVNTASSRAVYTPGYQETRYRTAYRTSRPHRSRAKTPLTIARRGATGA